jgi:hypothetical protein
LHGVVIALSNQSLDAGRNTDFLINVVCFRARVNSAVVLLQAMENPIIIFFSANNSLKNAPF